MAYGQGTLTPLATWCRPFSDLHIFFLLRLILFPNLSLFFRTMLFQHPSVHSRFCLLELDISNRVFDLSGFFELLSWVFMFTILKMQFIIELSTYYTNGKKKQCIAKMLITHAICTGWAWKFINMVSPIHSFNYQHFTLFYVRLVRHLFFLWKLHFMPSATEKQHATKFIDAKRKFMELLIRKPLYFS